MPMNNIATVYLALCETVERRGNATALVFKKNELSYRELLDRIDSTVRSLMSHHIGRGDVFAIYAETCPEIVLCYYAAAKLGAVFVPINPNMTGSEVRYIIEHSEAKCLFHDEKVASAAIHAMSQDRRFPVSALAQSPSDSAASAPASGPGGESDRFLIIYTSGSTGAPKAVELGHAAQVAVCDSLMELWGISHSDVTVVALPLGYLYGLSTAVAVGLRAGGRVNILPRFRPGDVIDALVSARATVFHGVPTMYSMMLDYAEKNGIRIDLSGVRQMISAGAPLADETVSRFQQRFGKKIQNYYAMTECTPVFGVYASDASPVPAGAIGKKAPGVFVKVIGRDGRECGPGVDGELLVRGPATLTRYLKNPDLTAASIDNGWFKSGDLGHYDDEGYYYITGRIKDIIIRGGANIAPAEVEKVLSTHPRVHEVAVIGVPDPVFGEVPVAFVVKTGIGEIPAETLIQHAANELADFKVPQTYVFENQLPIGKTGKVDKNALKQRWLAEKERRSRGAAGKPP
jgi:long-chain acyl-CoA synthetase